MKKRKKGVKKRGESKKKKDIHPKIKRLIPTTSIFLIFIAIITILVYFKPEITGNTVVMNYIGNQTWQQENGTIQNESFASGGYVHTINITVLQQTDKWKAYLGNVTGTLALEDTRGARFYDWLLLTSLTGTIFVTRNETTPTWTAINCTWAFISNGSSTTNINNRNISENENILLSHTNPDDNITATFSKMNHTSFWVGSIQIPANYCWNTNPYINNQSQDNTSLADTYDELLLYDGAGNIIYTTQIEDDQPDYSGDKLFDFQMLVPEYASPTFATEQKRRTTSPHAY